MSAAVKSRYDVVVVGGGSAGCAIAARLADDPEVSVLLLEAGGTNHRMLVEIPLAWRPVSQMKGFTWGFRTEPQSGLDGRSLDEPRGKILGGSSSIHGMMYSRGNPADYDGWAAQGLDGWSYQDVLPYFRRGESNWRGASEYHGDAGPLHVGTNTPNPVLYPAMIRAAREVGYDENSDFNGEQQTGFGMPDFMVQPNGRRDSSATAYLDRRRRSNLTVVPHALVGKILLNGTRATGVEYRRRGRVERVNAGEVIVSAGTYSTPHLLQLSGIGDPELITAAGVTTRHELPAVGQNLQDHPMVFAAFQGAHGLRLDRELRLDRLAVDWVRWLVGARSTLSAHPLSAQAYLHTHSQSAAPDTQFQIVHVPYISRPWLPGEKAPGDQFMGACLQLHPTARGTVTLRSNDRTAAPKIDSRLLTEAEDQRAARDMLRFIVRFFDTDALGEIVGQRIMPLVDLDDDAAVDAYLRATIDTGKHPVGTCAMGTDPATSVVDAELRVHGLDGLRIADGSVIPTQVSGNTDAPIKMIAEKAADLILGDSAETTVSILSRH